jgi:phage terminase large subunit-like protein
MNNYILSYYQKIVDGSESVNRWVRLAYEMIVERLEKKEVFYDGNKAKAIIFFFENFVHHTKGRSDLVKLELWQKAGLSAMFAIVDENGDRVFNEVVWTMGRKQGKSLIAYGCGEYEFLGFDGEYGAEVYCLAPKLDQADIVYGGIKKSIDSEPELSKMVKSRKTDLYVAENNSTCKKIAFSEKKSDGFNPQFVIADEFAAWPGEAGKKQYEVMASALGARRQPMIFAISTANYIKEGLYDELRRRGTRVLLGDSKEKHLLPLFYEIDDDDKWDDINELKKALPNLGVSMSVKFILDEITKARESLSKKNEFMTKYCCKQQNSTVAWLSTKDINTAMCDELKMEDFRETYAVGGIDLSQTTDLTAAGLLIEKDGVEYWLAHAWLPSEKIEDATARDGIPYREMIQKGYLSPSGENIIDYHDVVNWFVNAAREYHIYPLISGFDRYSATFFVDEMKQMGFKMDDVWQGFNMTPAIQKLEGSIKDGKIKIGQNELVRVHLLDTAVKADTDSRRVKIVKLNPSSSHIDLCAALLDALIVKDKWHAQIGEQLKNKRG